MEKVSKIVPLRYLEMVTFISDTHFMKDGILKVFVQKGRGAGGELMLAASLSVLHPPLLQSSLTFGSRFSGSFSKREEAGRNPVSSRGHLGFHSKYLRVLLLPHT